MAYDDYQGSEYDGAPDPAGSGWTLPAERKYQMTPLDEPAPVPAASVKPAAPTGKPVTTAGGLLGSLSSAIKSQAGRVMDGMNKVAAVATAKPDYQAAAMQRQGYQPADYQYSAPDGQAPASPFYKYDPGRNETTYQIPGVKGSATFSGQRKGGGSFSVVPGLSDGEKRQYAEIQNREAAQRQSAAMINHYAGVANALGLTQNQLLRVMGADAATDRADRSLESKQNQFNQRLELDNDRLDLAKLTAQERAKRSNEWLEFQRWRSDMADKRRAFKAGKKRNDDLSAAPVVGEALAALEAVPGAVLMEAGQAENVGVEPLNMAA